MAFHIWTLSLSMMCSRYIPILATASPSHNGVELHCMDRPHAVSTLDLPLAFWPARSVGLYKEIPQMALVRMYLSGLVFRSPFSQIDTVSQTEGGVESAQGMLEFPVSRCPGPRAYADASFHRLLPLPTGTSLERSPQPRSVARALRCSGEKHCLGTDSDFPV